MFIETKGKKKLATYYDQGEYKESLVSFSENGYFILEEENVLEKIPLEQLCVRKSLDKKYVFLSSYKNPFCVCILNIDFFMASILVFKDKDIFKYYFEDFYFSYNKKKNKIFIFYLLFFVFLSVILFYGGKYVF